MAETEYRYDAFISYRHIPADMLVAERLQQLLERHRKEDGTSLRVFRDRSELPTSSDLGNDIHTALDQSRFLIVVCSPEYQNSQWCMSELAYFRSIHDDSNRNILAIVVEGAPQDVFPQPLLWEKEQITRPDGTQELVKRQVEPLGADVRAENDRQRLKLLKVEYLRLLAPILGCGFDDLYQRDQRRKKNRILAAACAVAAFAVAFSLYSGYMVSQISRRQQQLEQAQWELYANESRRLAGEAMDVAATDLELAMQLADIALPEDLETPERPLEKDAEAALGNAVLNAHIQKASCGIHPEETVSLKSGFISFSGLADDGKKLVFYNPDYVWIYDGKHGELLCTIPSNGYTLLLNEAATVYCDTFSQSLSETSRIVGAEVCDAMTGQVIGNFVMEVTEFADGTATLQSVYYPDLDRFYLILHHAGAAEQPEDQVCGWIDTAGNTGTASTLPDGAYRTELTGGCTEYSGEEEIVSMLRDRYGEDAAITCTRDERIYFVYELDGSVSSTGVQKVKTTPWGAEEEMELYSTDGRCFQSAYDGIFYSLKTSGEDVLQIFSYDPDALGQMVTDAELIECISDSGALGTVRLDVHEQGLVENLNDRNSPISVVPDPFINGYRITPDFKHILLQTDNYKTLQLYEVESGKLLLELDGRNFYQAASCVDAEGKRVAVAYTEDGTPSDRNWIIDIYDVATKSCIQTIPIPDCDILHNRSMEEAVMELSGNFLCLSFTNASYLVDLENPSDYITIAGHQSYQCYTYSIPTDRIFQPDGLLIVPGNRGFYWEYIRKINVIYDLNEKRTVSFEHPSGDYEVFCYDAVTGSLILADHGILSVQRRESGGDFQEVYRITAKDPTVQLDTVLPACDGKYLVLNGESQAEIYDISTGTLLYVLPHTGSHTPHFCVIGGVLYDAAGKIYATGEIPRYELLDTAGWRELARELLTEDGMIRTLTQEECLQYYVPTQWLGSAQ